MPRRRRFRWVSHLPPFNEFGPPNSSQPTVNLTLEELEALRLSDYLQLDQIECAERMGISQPTFHRILSSAHYKVADALSNGKRIVISSGHAQVNQGSLSHYKCPKCGYEWDYPQSLGKPKKCPQCGVSL